MARCSSYFNYSLVINATSELLPSRNRSHTPEKLNHVHGNGRRSFILLPWLIWCICMYVDWIYKIVFFFNL